MYTGDTWVQNFKPKKILLIFRIFYLKKKHPDHQIVGIEIHYSDFGKKYMSVLFFYNKIQYYSKISNNISKCDII